MSGNSCVIFAKDIEAVSLFYQAVLNMEVSESEQTHRVLSGGSTELVIHAIPKKIADNITITKPPEPRAAAAIKPAFEVDSLEQVRIACEKTNGGLKPVTQAWDIRGAKVLDGWDPEGNIIQFKQFLK